MEFELYAALEDTRIIAILRGVTEDEAVEITTALYEAGIRIVEVPLNSPKPFHSIEWIARRFTSEMIVGAGTVLDPDDVDRVVDAGGRLVVAPNMNPWVIERCEKLGVTCAPGVATPSEAFAALDCGADALKAFPAEMLPPRIVKAWRAVLPERVPVIAVGGITPDNMAPYLEAGAAGFGVGSSLYRPGDTPEKVAGAAAAFVDALGGRSDWGPSQWRAHRL